MKSITSGTARIKPIVVKPEMRIQTLSLDDLNRIHQATLNILAETGVRFPSQRALDIFAEYGADVDVDRQIVKIQPGILESALDKAPRIITMGSRGTEDLDMVLDDFVKKHKLG